MNVNYRVIVLDTAGEEIANSKMHFHAAAAVTDRLSQGASAIRLDKEHFGGSKDRWIPVHNISEISVEPYA